MLEVNGGGLRDAAASVWLLTREPELRPGGAAGLDVARVLRSLEGFVATHDPGKPTSVERIQALMDVSRWLSARHADNVENQERHGVSAPDTQQIAGLKRALSRILETVQGPPPQKDLPGLTQAIDQMLENLRKQCFNLRTVRTNT